MVMLFIVLMALVILALAAVRCGANSSDGSIARNGRNASAGMAFTKPVNCMIWFRSWIGPGLVSELYRNI